MANQAGMSSGLVCHTSSSILNGIPLLTVVVVGLRSRWWVARAAPKRRGRGAGAIRLESWSPPTKPHTARTISASAHRQPATAPGHEVSGAGGAHGCGTVPADGGGLSWLTVATRREAGQLSGPGEKARVPRESAFSPSPNCFSRPSGSLRPQTQAAVEQVTRDLEIAVGDSAPRQPAAHRSGWRR
jgi:hypothetical protein